MAPLPENNTAVLFVDYDTCGEPHQLQCRMADASTVTEAMDGVNAFLTALGNSHRLMTITGARHRAALATVTTDVVWTGAATYGIGAGTHDESAKFYDFIGRSAGGRRVRVGIFGAIIGVEGEDYRLAASSDPAFSGALAVLVGAIDHFVAIDGLPASWKPYVNLGQNAYWRNHIRA